MTTFTSFRGEANFLRYLNLVINNVKTNRLFFSILSISLLLLVVLFRVTNSYGETVNINGSDFGTAQGIGSVQINGSSATITYWSNSKVTCYQSLPLVKVLNVVLLTDSGKSASFTLNNPSFRDLDGDGIDASIDNCPNTSNTNQSDLDDDGLGDKCDDCPNDKLNDKDNDGSCADVDNCPDVANQSQLDSDNDGLGDACDSSWQDTDDDDIANQEDNCPYTANPGQSDADNDKLGDKCDSCPNDYLNDIDNDGICANVDNCPDVANHSQTDSNNNGVGDLCESVPEKNSGDESNNNSDDVTDDVSQDTDLEPGIHEVPIGGLSSINAMPWLDLLLKH